MQQVYLTQISLKKDDQEKIFKDSAPFNYKQPTRYVLICIFLARRNGLLCYTRQICFVMKLLTLSNMHSVLFYMHRWCDLNLTCILLYFLFKMNFYVNLLYDSEAAYVMRIVWYILFYLSFLCSVLTGLQENKWPSFQSRSHDSCYLLEVATKWIVKIKCKQCWWNEPLGIGSQQEPILDSHLY